MEIETLVSSKTMHPNGKRKNTIKGLADHNGTIQEDGATMCSIVQDYFGNLFTLELGEPDPAVLTDVQHCVT